MDIKYVKGDATRPVGAGVRVIVHICNDVGGWGAGFVLAISKRWKEPERSYRAWHRGQSSIPFELGQIELVQVEPELWVANLIGQHGLHAVDGVPPVRYDALKEGLRRVSFAAQGLRASVHMPRIACGLAGGEWKEVEPLIKKELTEQGVATTVYDLGV